MRSLGRLRSLLRCAPKAIAPSTTKKTKVASNAPGDPATAGEPSTSLTSSPEAETATSSSKPSRQTTKKVVTALTRTSAVYVSGLTKRMLSKTPALIGYSVHARDGSMKSVLIMIYIGHNAHGNDLLCLFCCV